MEAFRNLDWSLNAKTLIEASEVFLPEEYIAESYIYKGLKEETEPVANNAKDEEQTCTVPGKKLMCFTGKYSKLSRITHNMCLKAVQLLNLGKDVDTLNSHDAVCIREYNACKAEILEENKQYQELAEKRWRSLSAQSRFGVQRQFLVKARQLWKRRLQHVFKLARFYDKMDMIALASPEESQTLQVSQIHSILELGSLAKFTPPATLYNFTTNRSAFINSNEPVLSSKMPVSEDENISNLLKDHSFSIAISSSALKRLMDNTDYNAVWHIPVVVKNRSYKDSNGVDLNRKIVYIDKPLPYNSYSALEFAKLVAKRVVKGSVCQFEAFSFPNEESPVDNIINDDINLKIQKCFSNDNTLKNPRSARKAAKKNKQNKKSIVEDTEDESPAGKEEDNIEKEEDNIEKEEDNIEKEEDNIEKETSVVQDNRINEEKTSDNVIHVSKKSNATSQIHHNVSYRLWNFSRKRDFFCKGDKDEKDLNVLVRCKLDACTIAENASLQPLIVQPKLEPQLECGAQIPTKNELSHAWTSLFFRPFSNLCRVRIDSRLSHIIAFEHCNMQKINSEAMFLYEYKPHLGLEVLYRILNAVSNLNEGSYLLYHEPKFGPFVGLYKPVLNETKCDNTLDLYSFYLERCKFNMKGKTPWIPLDPNFVLPRHEVHKQLPLTFRPAVGKIRKQIKKKLKRKQKALAK